MQLLSKIMQEMAQAEPITSELKQMAIKILLSSLSPIHQYLVRLTQPTWRARRSWRRYCTWMMVNKLVDQDRRASRQGQPTAMVRSRQIERSQLWGSHHIVHYHFSQSGPTKPSLSPILWDSYQILQEEVPPSWMVSVLAERKYQGPPSPSKFHLKSSKRNSSRSPRLP